MKVSPVSQNESGSRNDLFVYQSREIQNTSVFNTRMYV